MLERILAGDYQGEYEKQQNSGSYYPRGFEATFGAQSYFLI